MSFFCSIFAAAKVFLTDEAIGTGDYPHHRFFLSAVSETDVRTAVSLCRLRRWEHGAGLGALFPDLQLRHRPRKCHFLIFSFTI